MGRRFYLVPGADPDPGPGHYNYWGYGGSESAIQRAVRMKGRATFSYTSRVRRSIEDQIAPDVIAAGNIGCMMQIGSGAAVPVVHSVELLDWATGGPRPRALSE